MPRPPFTHEQLVARTYAFLNESDVDSAAHDDVPADVRCVLANVPRSALVAILVARDLTVGRVSQREAARRYNVHRNTIRSLNN